jgi:hypothetical protein
VIFQQLVLAARFNKIAKKQDWILAKNISISALKINIEMLGRYDYR